MAARASAAALTGANCAFREAMPGCGCSAAAQSIRPVGWRITRLVRIAYLWTFIRITLRPIGGIP